MTQYSSKAYPNTRKTSRSLSLPFYYTGQTCKHGHTDKRYTSTGNCVTCIDLYTKTPDALAKRTKRAEAQKQANRDRRIESQYTIGKAAYDAKLTVQLNKCAICDTTHQEAKGKMLIVDEAHATGKIRDLLCANCLMMLKAVKDDINTLNRLIKYIERHR